jgi:hypothetical protein
LIQASSVVARYRQNLPTFSAGTSPRFDNPNECFARPAENRPPLLLPSSRAILVNRSVFVALKMMPDYE